MLKFGSAKILKIITVNLEKVKMVLFNGPPKCRSRTVVRLVMLAAWAKQSLLNDYPKCRSVYEN
ncbi:MAG: hypothetical protein WC721_06815 [Victivallaceae bacterium]|jgi:hypothetical protein